MSRRKTRTPVNSTTGRRNNGSVSKKSRSANPNAISNHGTPRQRKPPSDNQRRTSERLINKRKKLIKIIDLSTLYLRRKSSLKNAETHVLVIYTGGTIGMMRNEKNALEPRHNEFVRKIRQYPSMHDNAYASKRFGSAKKAPLVLPYVEGQNRRIMYQIYEYEPLLDSSNMGVDDWIRIATDIKLCYKSFDGFVVLHGTDTLSYTASALSFMFENLGKTVIITGSQIPIFETRTDGKDNFTSALILAGNYVIPEVCVFFNSRLFRGNRTIKVSSDSLDAFNSPNFAPLAKMGVNIEIDDPLIFPPRTEEEFNVHGHIEKNVGLLRLFPSISTPTVDAFLKDPMRGVVLQTYGAGNIPSGRENLVEALKKASKRGVLIVNCTQCNEGSVCDLYETGQPLRDMGAVPGFDMTPEAALAKLAYVLSKHNGDPEKQKLMLKKNLRGELTHEETPEMQESNLIHAVDPERPKTIRRNHQKAECQKAEKTTRPKRPQGRKDQKAELTQGRKKNQKAERLKDRIPKGAILKGQKRLRVPFSAFRE